MFREFDTFNIEKISLIADMHKLGLKHAYFYSCLDIEARVRNTLWDLLRALALIVF